MMSGKSLPITKRMVWKAYQSVKGNGEAAGVDGQSLDDFAQDLENNLYKLWNAPGVRKLYAACSSAGRDPQGKGWCQATGHRDRCGSRRTDGGQTASGTRIGSTL